MNTEKDLHNPETQPHPLLRSLRNVAAIFLAVILLSSAMIAWGNSETAHDLKFRLKKAFNEVVAV